MMPASRRARRFRSGRRRRLEALGAAIAHTMVLLESELFIPTMYGVMYGAPTNACLRSSPFQNRT
jgi:hypothetical protein